ncbi:MAG: energy-coupling factor ABC transporter ATP-binding protein, partial [Candidatus Margulisiibacteriota bacterium]
MNKTILKVENLSYTYPDGTKALQDINLEVYEGESVAILGPNGAGKSTLLMQINGVLRGEGKIEVFNLPLTDGHLKEIRKKVGLVFQDPEDQLFMLTVYEDVGFGPANLNLSKDEIKVRVKEALAKVGMLEFEQKSPHHLSFGQKKRIALATVLSMNPELLLLDEPTSNLDPASRLCLIEILKEIKATKIIATNELEVAQTLCSKSILLEAGRIKK